MRIEIIHYRDSDGGCDHEVFVDGEPQRNVVVEDIDPGRGYVLSGWDDTTADIDNRGYTPDFAARVKAGRDEVRGNKYIEDDLGEED